jgi:hypothetical protein
MEFSKPKVTIDLEEYTELIKKINTVSPDNEALSVILGLLKSSNSFDFRYLLEVLSRDAGIRLTITHNPSLSSKYPIVKTEKI